MDNFERDELAREYAINHAAFETIMNAAYSRQFRLEGNAALTMFSTARRVVEDLVSDLTLVYQNPEQADILLGQRYEDLRELFGDHVNRPGMTILSLKEVLYGLETMKEEPYVFRESEELQDLVGNFSDRILPFYKEKISRLASEDMEGWLEGYQTD